MNRTLIALPAALALTLLAPTAASAQFAPTQTDDCAASLAVVADLQAQLAALADTDPARAALETALVAELLVVAQVCDDPTATPTPTPTATPTIPTATPTASPTVSPTARPTLTAVPTVPPTSTRPDDRGGQVDRWPSGGVATGDGSTA